MLYFTHFFDILNTTEPLFGAISEDTMSDLEKINIYVPEKIGKVLTNDVLSFEILKRDMHSPNWNRFLNMLLLGYYDQYITEYQQVLDTVMSILQETTLTMPINNTVISVHQALIDTKQIREY